MQPSKWMPNSDHCKKVIFACNLQIYIFDVYRKKNLVLSGCAHPIGQRILEAVAFGRRDSGQLRLGQFFHLMYTARKASSTSLCFQFLSEGKHGFFPCLKT